MKKLNKEIRNLEKKVSKKVQKEMNDKNWVGKGAYPKSTVVFGSSKKFPEPRKKRWSNIDWPSFLDLIL